MSLLGGVIGLAVGLLLVFAAHLIAEWWERR